MGDNFKKKHAFLLSCSEGATAGFRSTDFLTNPFLRPSHAILRFACSHVGDSSIETSQACHGTSRAGRRRGGRGEHGRRAHGCPGPAGSAHGTSGLKKQWQHSEGLNPLVSHGSIWIPRSRAPEMPQGWVRLGAAELAFFSKRTKIQTG